MSCARGFEYGELVRRTRAGSLARVRWGAYAGSVPERSEDRHRQLIEATLPRLASDACVSHQSAAVLHGLPTWSDQLTHVHVTRPLAHGRRRTVSYVHAAPVSTAEMVEINGLRVTSLARTVADCARTLPFPRAVAMGDAALRIGLVRSDLEALLDRPRCPGLPQARRVAAFIDGRAESPGESLSRIIFSEHRVPSPEPQFKVLDSGGELVARTDFGWEELRTVGEFDGKVKYGRLLRPGEEPGDVVYRESSARTCCVTSAGRWCGGPGAS